ncbi:hypothetical protein, partial [Mesorhizobium sp. M00.F.Ca.ET.216.01.1.1]|uniref:hypothetical protein n=1 Tax=Mesorhizobium sp. M00.F.Ca.ET.216.01.1.1 TaxID=2500528 RepID=UPI001AEF1602
AAARRAAARAGADRKHGAVHCTVQLCIRRAAVAAATPSTELALRSRAHSRVAERLLTPRLKRGVRASGARLHGVVL